MTPESAAALSCSVEAKQEVETNAEQKWNPRLRPESKLEVAGAALPQQVVLRLVDDWIVPALVEEFLRRERTLPECTETEHNETQL